MKEEGELGESSQTILNLQDYQDQLLLQQQELEMQPPPPPPPLPPQSSRNMFGSAGMISSSSSSGLLFPPEPSPLIPWTLPPVNSFNPSSSHFPPNHETHFFIPPSPLIPPPYGNLFNRRGPPPHQFPYDGSGPFGLQAELGKMSAQEIMDAKALAASKSHSEAERRRRERINNHFAKLRSLLPSTTKTDKASLLAEVIQHVKELKRQTSIIAETSPIPTETDELQVDTANEDGKFVIKASLCCEDRSDLLPELIKTLKALRLRTLKAEITTLGDRVKNVLFVASEDQLLEDHPSSSSSNSISTIQEALKGVMERAGGEDTSSGNVKRQRTNVNSNILEQQQLNRSL